MCERIKLDEIYGYMRKILKIEEKRRRTDNNHIKHKLTNEWENSFLVKLSSLGLAPLILCVCVHVQLDMYSSELISFVTILPTQ